MTVGPIPPLPFRGDERCSVVLRYGTAGKARERCDAPAVGYILGTRIILCEMCIRSSRGTGAQANDRGHIVVKRGPRPTIEIRQLPVRRRTIAEVREALRVINGGRRR